MSGGKPVFRKPFVGIAGFIYTSDRAQRDTDPLIKLYEEGGFFISSTTGDGIEVPTAGKISVVITCPEKMSPASYSLYWELAEIEGLRLERKEGSTFELSIPSGCVSRTLVATLKIEGPYANTERHISIFVR